MFTTPSTAATTHTNGSVFNVAAIKGSTAYQFIIAPSDGSSPPNPYVIRSFPHPNRLRSKIHRTSIVFRCLLISQRTDTKDPKNDIQRHKILLRPYPLF